MLLLSHLHKRAFAKATQIWNGSHRPDLSEAMKTVLIVEEHVNYPTAVRWNSLFDCTSIYTNSKREQREADAIDIKQNCLNVSIPNLQETRSATFVEEA